ncbi:hypothetical protein WMY93_011109 [Mugilogobius chulae]|uniref:CCZ1/INTU/HSP4 first Longin domain-containing protein n=1 Tax=Mugilogobius chulae TaxID=88201 RepID=A0AAW0PAJ0_9GOBI
MISPRMATGMQEKQYTPSLLSFFIYNPTFGPREGEEEKKILFYHPSDVEKNEKIRNVGLCEAIVQFTRTFCPTKPAKSLHTQKNRQFFFEPEENFWIVMVVRNPMVEKPNKDGKPPTVEYQEEEILDTVYGAVVRQCYSMYKLFNGTFGRAMEAGGVEQLIQKLEKFFYRYLQTLHLQSCDLLDVFGGISFFPLDKMTYLKIQSFVNRVEESLSLIKYTAFLYNDQLIWSGLEQDDMRILYKYLTTSLFPRHSEPELAGRDSPLRPEVTGNLLHYGRFLTGPTNFKDPEAKFRFPRIFVSDDDGYEELHLIVYKAMSAAACFMISASVELTREFCEQLDSLVGPQLTLLASDICEQFTINRRISGTEKEPQFKFIYFNHMNLAEKSTIHMRKTASVCLTSVHPDLMKILGDINCDFARVDEDEEIIVKAMTDYWVVGKKSDQRELYVILNQKNANLIEVNQTVNMESRFAHLRQRDNSVSMLRVKMSRRRSQSLKENRERLVNNRRQLDALQELELSSLDTSIAAANVSIIQENKKNNTQQPKYVAGEERLKQLQRWKERKALEKEKEQREKARKGVFKTGLYHPKDARNIAPLPPIPAAPGRAKETKAHVAPTQTTRVTRSMKQQQLQPLQTQDVNAVGKKTEPPIERATRNRAPTLKPAPTVCKTKVEPAKRALSTRSTNKPPVTAAPVMKDKPKDKCADVRTTRSKVVELAPAPVEQKKYNVTTTDTVPAVSQEGIFKPELEKKEEKLQSPRSTLQCEDEDMVVDQTVPDPTLVDDVTKSLPKVSSFAPEGFLFQAPVVLSSVKFEPLTPRSADAFLTPSSSFTLPSAPTFEDEPKNEVSPSNCPLHLFLCIQQYLKLNETDRLTSLCTHWESKVEDESIPEEMRDRMRTAVGQARLLMKERFKQFSGLVDDCDFGRGEKITTCTDLQGFWDMVYFQVEDVNKKFDALKKAEECNWVEELKPVPRQRKVVKKPAAAPASSKPAGTKAAAKSRLAAAKAAMKARQQAESAEQSTQETQPEAQSTNTVIFNGGSFQVTSPPKPPSSVRRSSRLSAAVVPQPSPSSNCLTPRRVTRRSLAQTPIQTSTIQQPMNTPTFPRPVNKTPAPAEQFLPVIPQPQSTASVSPCFSPAKEVPSDTTDQSENLLSEFGHSDPTVTAEEQRSPADLKSVQSPHLSKSSCNRPLECAPVPSMSLSFTLSPCTAQLSLPAVSCTPCDLQDPPNMQGSLTATPNSSINEGTGVNFERYLQPLQRSSLSPRQPFSIESPMVMDIELESPKGQPEDPLTQQDAVSTSLHVVPTLSSESPQTVESALLLFTPDLKDRIRQSVCPSDLMVFTPPHL